jgi:uncharacterized protein YjbJ (UPF0337 family)
MRRRFPDVSNISKYRFNKDKEMSKDRIDGGWKQMKANAKRQWGRTKDDLADSFEARHGHVAKVLDRHGLAKEEMKYMLTDWPNRYKEKRKKDH